MSLTIMTEKRKTVKMLLVWEIISIFARENKPKRNSNYK